MDAGIFSLFWLTLSNGLYDRWLLVVIGSDSFGQNILSLCPHRLCCKKSAASSSEAVVFNDVFTYVR